MGELTPLVIVTGILALVWVSFGTALGLILIYKYTKYKYKPLLYWGLSFIVLMKIWWAVGINFLLILMGRDVMSLEIYTLISFGVVPLDFIFWGMAWTYVVYKERFKLGLSILVIYGIVAQMIFWTLFFTDVNLLVSQKTPLGCVPIGLLLLLSTIQIFAFILLAVILCYKGFKSKDPEIRVKGLLFLGYALSLFIGLMIDSMYIDYLSIFISRAFYITSGVLLYIYLVWPDWAKKILLRKK
ncbi:MAG: hypothetical protein ACFFAN_18725 [Promethearchaeota archaeon]